METLYYANTSKNSGVALLISKWTLRKGIFKEEYFIMI